MVPVQIADEVPDTVPAMADEVPECSGTHSKQSSGGFRCRWFRRRWLMRFRRVLVQMADEVPEGCGADCRQGSGDG